MIGKRINAVLLFEAFVDGGENIKEMIPFPNGRVQIEPTAYKYAQPWEKLKGVTRILGVLIPLEIFPKYQDQLDALDAKYRGLGLDI